MPPAAFPRFDASPANWTGLQLAATPARWIHDLTAAEIADLDSVIAKHGDRAEDLIGLSHDDAPLPVLGPVLRRIRHELLDGCGVALIRGLDVAGKTVREAATAFWAVGLHLGEAVSQNARGHVLGHVKDLGFDYSQPSARGYQTSERLPYHCDSGDVVGLLSLKTAKSGGLSSAVSSTALYHAIVADYPEHAATLMQPTWRDRRDEIPDGAEPWYAMPVFTPHEGRLFGHYVRSAIRKAQRFEGVPRITPEQEAASMSSTSSPPATSCVSTWSSSPATCSSCAITGCCTAARSTRTGRSRTSGGTCCGSGSAVRTGRRCRSGTPWRRV